MPLREHIMLFLLNSLPGEPDEPHPGLVLGQIAFALIALFTNMLLRFFFIKGVPNSWFLTCPPGVSLRRGWR